jgi:hypothetical protein
MVGLPGTGLGGVFYVGLTFWMLVREVANAVLMRNNLNRWQPIMRLTSISVLIIVALFFESYLIRRFIAEDERVYELVPLVGSLQLGMLSGLFALIHLVRSLTIAKANRRFLAKGILKNP